jgi:hypothetical protein
MLIQLSTETNFPLLPAINCATGGIALRIIWPRKPRDYIFYGREGSVLLAENMAKISKILTLLKTKKGLYFCGRFPHEHQQYVTTQLRYYATDDAIM